MQFVIEVALLSSYKKLRGVMYGLKRRGCLVTPMALSRDKKYLISKFHFTVYPLTEHPGYKKWLYIRLKK